MTAKSSTSVENPPGLGRLPSAPITVNSWLPMRTFLPIGSMLGNSACHGPLPRSTTLRRCSTSARDEQAPELDLREVHRRPVLGGAEHAQLFGPLVAVVDPRAGSARGAEPDVDQRDRRALALDRPRVLHGQVGPPRHFEEALARREAERAPLLDDDGVGPELADRFAQRVVEAADQRRHADDRRDADDDAEHGQRRAHLARAQRVERHRDDFGEQAGCACPPWLLPPQRFDRDRAAPRASPGTGRRTVRRPP